MDEQDRISELTRLLGEYTRTRNLNNTAVAYPIVQKLLYHSAIEIPERFNVPVALQPWYHSLSVAGMLMELNLPLENAEIDLCIAAALCHVRTEQLLQDPEGKVLKDLLDPRVFEIISLATGWQGMSDEVKAGQQLRMQKDRLAILVALADRGDRMGQLYGASPWRVHQYINETREFLFPLCIYAKENYPEIYRPVSILMEKMRSLIELNEIMLDRYEAEENALSREILHLQEENARIRVIIRQLEKEQ